MNIQFARKRPARIALAICAGFLAGRPALAQNRFVNFEAPQVSPIALATVGQSTFVLVCNTPDSSVEIYDAHNFGGPRQGYKARVPVGQSPVTVRWNNALQKFYTCNFVGDSVSIGHISITDGVTGILERTVNVGDEPTDIVFPSTLPGQAVVSLHGLSKMIILDELTLAKDRTETLVEGCDLVTGICTIGERHAVKAPRRLGALPDGRLLALNAKGGNRSDYDLDLFVLEGTDPDSDPTGLVGGMGSTNMSFSYDGTTNDLYVVGGFAQNSATLTALPLSGAQAKAEPLGFVRSFLWIVDMKSPGTLPVVRGEPTESSAPFTTLRTIDLNRDYTASGFTPIQPKEERVSQPTDVLIIPGEAQPEHIVVACFGSDSVLILSPDPNGNGGWLRTQVDIAPLVGYGASGPRGLAYDSAQDRVWVVNRLDNSLACFTPDAVTPGTVTRIPLKNDPTPDVIRTGRQFLYSAHETSGEQMVACASCHVDGRTDSLAWNLGDPGPSPGGEKEIEQALIDKELTFPTHFSFDKGPLVTQTLENLVNSHMDHDAAHDLQYIMTNAPYHWRGDKDDFTDFNEAFVNLQGMSEHTPGSNTGLSTSDMIAYREFVETIRLQGNPKQPNNRRYEDDGTTLGLNANDEHVGTGALQGMKIYHIKESMGVRACVHCHTLPEGSSNTFFLAPTPDKPLENAQVRGLFQREQALVDDFGPTDPLEWVRVADFGLTHNGTFFDDDRERTINDFNFNAFPNLTTKQGNELTEFSRKIDWGIAPMIGETLTVDSDLLNDPVAEAAMRDALHAMEDDASEANSGLAVYVRRNDGATIQGYWYDLATTAPPSAPFPAHMFRRVAGTSTITEDDLIDLVNTENDLIVFQSVPCGSERRLAHKSGTPPPLAARTPKNLELLPMVPNTAFEHVTEFTSNLDPTVGAGGGQPIVNRFISVQRTRALEDAVQAMDPANVPGLFGIADPALERHEPPRRLRVTGKNIFHGAVLRLGMVKGDPGSTEMSWATFELYPTKYRYDGVEADQVVWETTDELDFGMTMAFLNGGPELTPVSELLAARWEVPPTGSTDPSLATLAQALDPENLNWFEVEVINEDGTLGAALAPQRLEIATDRDIP